MLEKTKQLNVLKVDYEGLLTILMEIQRVINNRPSIYNYNDVDSEPLTPSHFIFRGRLDINYFNENSTLVEINQFNKKSIEQFWKLWSGEYRHIKIKSPLYHKKYFL